MYFILAIIHLSIIYHVFSQMTLGAPMAVLNKESKHAYTSVPLSFRPTQAVW